MDYKRIYAAFIADRRTKELTLIGYRERHHILPRCMGGTDDDSNLIYLTAEDHFFAHLLLAKAYGGEMWYALTAMTVEYGRRKECGEYLRRARKASALARERAARVHSARMKGVFSGEKHPMYGKPCPELAKQRTRERMAAGLYPMASTETRRKVSKALKGRVLTPEWRDKISRSRIGWRDSEETRLKKSRSHLGKKLSQESIEKLRVAMTGIKRSPETIERMRLANIGKSLSEETKRKISDRWKTHGHPRGMLGKTHSREYCEMMTRFNAAKKRYAVMFGVSSRSVTKDMLRIAGIEV